MQSIRNLSRTLRLSVFLSGPENPLTKQSKTWLPSWTSSGSLSAAISVPLVPYTPLKSYYPAFDGLRAIAVLLVFAVHYISVAHPAPTLLWGITGVDLFFVLSGFLITGILYDSRQQEGYFRNFYRRRALRIFPLFYGLWFLLLLLSVFLAPQFNVKNMSYFLYLGNLWYSVKSLDREALCFIPITLLGHHTRLAIGHFWSLCVEEQFYMVWPLVIWFAPQRAKLMFISSAGVLLVLGLRLFLYLHDPHTMIARQTLYFSTYSRFDTFLVGAFVSVWLRSVVITRENLHTLAMCLISVPFAMIAVGHAIMRHTPMSLAHPLVTTYEFTLIAFIAVGLLILAIDETTLFHRVLLLPWLARLGRISYGFYVFHMLPLPMVARSRPWFASHHALFLLPVLVFVITICISELSFRFYESFFLAMKNRPTKPMAKKEIRRNVPVLSS